MIPLHRKINVPSRPFYQCSAFWIARSFVIDYQFINETKYIYKFHNLEMVLTNEFDL